MRLRQGAGVPGENCQANPANVAWSASPRVGQYDFEIPSRGYSFNLIVNLDILEIESMSVFLDTPRCRQISMCTGAGRTSLEVPGA